MTGTALCISAILLLAIESFAIASESAFYIETHCKPTDLSLANVPSLLHRRQSTILPTYQKKNRYWFGNFAVGEAQGLELLIDTGSTDLLLNPGLYKPSPASKTYANHFKIVYEGIDKSGGGFETISGKVYSDIVSAGGFTGKAQAIGDITNYTVQDAPPKSKAVSGNGLIGFASKNASEFSPQAPSWFFNLCNAKAISQCRFGLAFGTNNKGLQVIGKIDPSLYNGSLTVAPLHENFFPSWTTQGDVVFDNDLHFKNQTLIMDMGTNNIQPPLYVAKAIFKKLGYGTRVYHGGPSPSNPKQNITFLQGFFPCNKPPVLGFTFPSSADLANPPPGAVISNTSMTFNVLGSEWSVHDNGNNNCTAVIEGTNALHFHDQPSIWLVGQPFYQGHYIDHNAGGTMGFARLKNPGNVHSESNK